LALRRVDVIARADGSLRVVRSACDAEQPARQRPRVDRAKQLIDPTCLPVEIRIEGANDDPRVRRGVGVQANEVAAIQRDDRPFVRGRHVEYRPIGQCLLGLPQVS